MTITVKSNFDFAAAMKAAGQEIRDNNLSERLRARTVASYFTADSPDKFRLVLRGTPIDEVISGSIFYSIDTAARGWSAVVPYDPFDTERAEYFKPRQFHRSEIYLGGKLVCTGICYGTAGETKTTGRHATLTGWSLSADAIDSSMFPPFEVNDITLEKRATALMQPFGIGVTYKGTNDKPFKRVTAGKSDKVMAHLLKLAKQRKQLVMSDAQGDLVVHEVASGSPIATIEEGTDTFQEGGFKFDGRKMFGSYTCYSKSPKRNKSATAFDDGVPVSRHTSINSSESDDADMASTAEREAQRALADSLTTKFPVTSWYRNPLTRDLWDANTIATVKSPTMFIPNGFDFLIRSVEYKFSDKATNAVLGIVPPEVYTGEPLEVW